MVFKAKKDDKKRSEPFTYPTYPTYASTETAAETSSLSFIGETMEIEGDITSDEDITIQGRVKGNIDVSKTLTIGKSGKVKADIKASIVRIIGEARGNIIAADKVEILSQGRYTGNIQSEKLVVSDGAILNGNINQDPKTKK